MYISIYIDKYITYLFCFFGDIMTMYIRNWVCEIQTWANQIPRFYTKLKNF